MLKAQLAASGQTGQTATAPAAEPVSSFTEKFEHALEDAAPALAPVTGIGGFRIGVHVKVVAGDHAGETGVLDRPYDEPDLGVRWYVHFLGNGRIWAD